MDSAQKLRPAVKDYIWGGDKLKDYGIAGGERIAEAWTLSLHADGPSTLEDGRTLLEAANKADFGRACDKFPFFPVLVKLIDARDNLSVQVHPDDEYALKHERSLGKTEMWLVLEAAAGAGLYVGFKRDLTEGELKNAVENGKILDELNFFAVKKGDCFFIPAGTVHAIGAGCTIAEVQQNSNLTYRVYDYGRVGADGLPRPLHVDKAVTVADRKKYVRPAAGTAGADCKYFTCFTACGAGEVGAPDSFTNVLFLQGSGFIDGRPAKKGDSFFISAGKTAKITGGAEYLVVFVK